MLRKIRKSITTRCGLIGLVVIGLPALKRPAAALDLVSMDYGDIFLAERVKEIDHRYQFNRNGHFDLLPTWWVKEITPNVEQLPLKQGDLILTPESRPELAGKAITITSATPAIASHLELYPQRTHYWRQSGTYLRGYLVNDTEENYQRLRVKLTYYGDDQKVKFVQYTQVFRVFGRTMKPFIVSTREVPWGRIARLDIRAAGSTPMR